MTASKMTTVTTGLFLLAMSVTADLNLAPSAEETQPLQPGDKAPAFTVHRVDGSPFAFDPDQLDRPTLIITFRGGWCPYCNTHLQELRHVIPEIKAAGYEVLFLSADRPEILYSSLKEENQELDYLVLSDSKLQASSVLGIAFQLPEAQIKRYKEYGLDLEKASGEAHHGLPVPAVFVIDPGGTITYTYANPDYKVRLSAAEVRAAALGEGT